MTEKHLILGRNNAAFVAPLSQQLAALDRLGFLGGAILSVKSDPKSATGSACSLSSHGIKLPSMNRSLALSALFLAFAQSLAYAQEPAKTPLNEVRIENGKVADRTYRNECLGFAFPIPDGWEVNNETTGMPLGKARPAPGGGLILLVLDQHTGLPIRNRIVLTAIDASGLTVDTEGFVSKFVQAQLSVHHDWEMLRDTYPANIAGRQFSRADFREPYSGGGVYKAFAATRFRNYFLGWALVAGSLGGLGEVVSSLERISFQDDRRNSECSNADRNAPAATTVATPAVSSELPAQPTSQRHPLRVRISQGVASTYLIKKVQPQYPEAARQAGIQGSVILKALIDASGNVEQVNAVSGNPVFLPAAFDAVKQWKYKPYLLEGQPVGVETQIMITFQLSLN